MIRFILFRLYCLCLWVASSWDRRHKELDIKQAVALRKLEIWERRASALEDAHDSYLKSKVDSDA